MSSPLHWLQRSVMHRALAAVLTLYVIAFSYYAFRPNDTILNDQLTFRTDRWDWVDYYAFYTNPDTLFTGAVSRYLVSRAAPYVALGAMHAAIDPAPKSKRTVFAVVTAVNALLAALTLALGFAVLQHYVHQPSIQLSPRFAALAFIAFAVNVHQLRFIPSMVLLTDPWALLLATLGVYVFLKSRSGLPLLPLAVVGHFTWPLSSLILLFAYVVHQASRQPDHDVRSAALRRPLRFVLAGAAAALAFAGLVWLLRKFIHDNGGTPPSYSGYATSDFPFAFLPITIASAYTGLVAFRLLPFLFGIVIHLRTVLTGLSQLWLRAAVALGVYFGCVGIAHLLSSPQQGFSPVLQLIVHVTMLATYPAGFAVAHVAMGGVLVVLLVWAYRPQPQMPWMSLAVILIFTIFFTLVEMRQCAFFYPLLLLLIPHFHRPIHHERTVWVGAASALLLLQPWRTGFAGVPQLLIDAPQQAWQAYFWMNPPWWSWPTYLQSLAVAALAVGLLLTGLYFDQRHGRSEAQQVAA